MLRMLKISIFLAINRADNRQFVNLLLYEFNFSDIHWSMNTMGHLQSLYDALQCHLLFMPLHATHCVRTSMTVRETGLEPPRDKTNEMACAPSEDSDQPGHPPSLIRVFAVRMKKAWVLSYPLSAQWRLWSDWVDAQDDLSLRWAHMPICWFCHEAAHFFLYYLSM